MGEGSACRLQVRLRVWRREGSALPRTLLLFPPWRTSYEVYTSYTIVGWGRLRARKMTQFEDRRQQRIDRATADRNKADWVKHTINLRKGSNLDTRFKESGNKSFLVRETFKRFIELGAEVRILREENEIMRENIAKLQARLVEDEVVEAKMHPNQSTLDGNPKPTALQQWADIQKELHE